MEVCVGCDNDVKWNGVAATSRGKMTTVKTKWRSCCCRFFVNGSKKDWYIFETGIRRSGFNGRREI
eukprot:scaffold77970_cov43-Attheya_sp.AAC.1